MKDIMKKIFNNIKYTLTTLILVFTFSCNNEAFFELTNPPEFPWLNVNQLEMAAVTPYHLTFGSDWGSYWQNYCLLSDCMSDVIYLLPNTSADIPYSEMYYRTTDVRVGKTDGMFVDIYQTIGACNAALDFYAENNDMPFPNSTEKDLENLLRIKGELLFMKAYAYFIAVKVFAPDPSSPEYKTLDILPLRREFPKNIEQANNAEFGTAAEIYEIIQSELVKAKDLLPGQFSAGLHHPSYQYGRANKMAAAFLLMQVYMQLGEYQHALDESNFIINSGYYSLDQDPLEAFSHSDPEKGNEVIWYVLYYDDVKKSIAKVFTSMNKSHYTAINGGRGASWSRCPWNQFCMSHSVAKYIGWMDENLAETEEALKDKRYLQLYYRLEGNNGDPQADEKVYETQYPHIKLPYIWGDKYFRGIDGRYTNVPVMRLAEVYLTRSILRLKTGDLAGALADVNIVRGRAGLIPLNEVTEDLIEKERIKELAFEGDRLSYLMALKKSIDPGDRENVQPVQPAYENFFWKIPQLELDMQNQNN
jgi:starch-binding outer membrane protein, SusD/RagB family